MGRFYAEATYERILVTTLRIECQSKQTLPDTSRQTISFRCRFIGRTDETETTVWFKNPYDCYGETLAAFVTNLRQSIARLDIGSDQFRSEEPFASRPRHGGFTIPYKIDNIKALSAWLNAFLKELSEDSQAKWNFETPKNAFLFELTEGQGAATLTEKEMLEHLRTTNYQKKNGTIRLAQRKAKDHFDVDLDGSWSDCL